MDDSEFRPTLTYDPDGDCIEVLLSGDNFYGKRLNELLTVYCSQEDNKVVGILIEGVSPLLKEKP